MTQYLVSINADEPELEEIKIENIIVEGNSDLRKLYCSCCLSESFTLLPTSNCSHYNHYKQYFDIKNLHNGEYVCVICHEMLKKIENFNNMVLDSYHILANNINVHNTRRKKFGNLQISTRPIITIKMQNSDQTIQFSDQELPEDIDDNFDRNDSIPLNKVCLKVQENNESRMIMPYCKADPSSSNNSLLTLMLTSESRIKPPVFICDPVHSESNSQEITFHWAPRINYKFVGKIKFVNITKEDYDKERAEKMKANEHYQNCEFKCNDCIFGYKTKKLLDEHILDKHTCTKKDNISKKEQCAYCKQFVKPPLSAHEEKHFGRFECCVCQYRCKSMATAIKHYNENHDERTRTYKIFGSVAFIMVSNRVILSIMVAPVYAEMPLIGAVYLWSEDLRTAEGPAGKPLMISLQQLRFECDYCGRSFKNKGTITKHIIAKHIKSPDLTCKKCNKQFACVKSKRTHQRYVHEKMVHPKNIICDYCGKAFTNSNILKDHVNTHTGERPHVCKYCGANFGHKAALYMHTRLVHLGGKKKSELKDIEK